MRAPGQAQSAATEARLRGLAQRLLQWRARARLSGPPFRSASATAIEMVPPPTRSRPQRKMRISQSANLQIHGPWRRLEPRSRRSLSTIHRITGAGVDSGYLRSARGTGMFRLQALQVQLRDCGHQSSRPCNAFVSRASYEYIRSCHALIRRDTQSRLRQSCHEVEVDHATPTQLES